MSEQRLTFSTRKVHGTYPVTAGDEVVARVRDSWTDARVTVLGPNNAPLSQAGADRWGLSRTWRATGPDGRPLLSMTARGLLRPRAIVSLERGGSDYEVSGRLGKPSFRVADAAGIAVVTGVPAGSAWRVKEYAVRQCGEAFTTTELVTLVQIWRKMSSDGMDAGVAAAGGSIASTAGMVG